MMAEQKDFFISYNQADRNWAEWVAWQLEQEGYKTIIQAWDFRPGSNFITEMNEAAKIVKCTIAILSSSYLNASYTQSEWAAAFVQDPTGEKRFLLPIRVYDCKPNGLFAAIGYIDLVGKDESTARQKLLGGVMHGRNKPDIPPTFPGSSPGSAMTKPAFPGKHDNSEAERHSSTSSATTSNKHNSSKEPHNSAKLLTATLGATILTYDIHADWIGTVAWSPDGERIASAGGDGTVRIWNANNGHNIVTYRGHSGGILARIFTNIWKASWSPDGQYIASSGSGPIVRSWEASTGKDILLYHGHEAMDPLLDAFALDWSPDGTCITSACSFKYTDQTVHIWNVATGSNLLKYSGHTLNNLMRSFSITNLAWSPNGQYIASSGSDRNVKKWRLDLTTVNKSIQVWSPTTGQHILTCGEASTWINGITWSPDNKHIAAGYNKVVGIWDIATGKNVFTYTGHTKEVRAVAWSPDGSIIASAGNDHTVHLWHPFTGELLFVYRGHTGNVATLAWSPDGKRVASAGVDKTVQIWQAM